MPTMRLMEPEDYIVPPTTLAYSSPEIARRFKDCIHDYLPFSQKICRIIDTPQVQRLRNIKQLGTSYHVWPTASHNRFEHSLGVAHLSNMLATHLQKTQPGLLLTQRDIDCVTIAGLCHDLGHGPWSHVWDSMFIPRALPDVSWQHEDASEMMFDALIRDAGIQAEERDVAFIKALIKGDIKKLNSREKPFLFDIVANKRNGLDVDKIDYIARDTYGVDQKSNLSLIRLIHSARVINDEICYDIKDANQVYELFYTRFSLHKRIYSHKTATAIEYMLVDALVSANRHMNFAQYISNPKKFLHLTDYVRTQIEASEEPGLEEARNIFHRITTRNLYRMVDYKVLEWDLFERCEKDITPENIVQAAKGLPETPVALEQCDDDLELDDDEPVDVAALEPQHIIVSFSRMHYGMKERNPLDSVKFYSKQHPDSARSAERGDISLLMPSVFGEVLLRVYTRDTRFYGLVQAGYRELLSQLSHTLNLSSQERVTAPAGGTGAVAALSPPTTAEPSTPPASQGSLSREGTGTGTGGTVTGTKPFSNNAFTAVPKNYRGTHSPTREQAQGARRGKRKERDGSPVPTRKSSRRA